jgi:hypothetical protein
VQYRPNGPLRTLVFTAMLGQAIAAPAADLSWGIEGGALHDSNVSRTRPNLGVLTDSALRADAWAGASFALGDRDSIFASANLRGAQYRRFSGLDVASLGGTFAYRAKLGLGAFAPRASISAFAAEENYRNDARDGRRTRFTVEAGRRLDERWDLSGGFGYERFSASNIAPRAALFSRDVFSTRARNLFARAEYAWSSRWLVYLAAAARRGDVVSSSLFDPQVFEHSGAIAPDAAFGPGYIAYRIGGRTGSATLGASFETSPQSSLNFGLTREATTITGGFDYRSTQVNLYFVYAH